MAPGGSIAVLGERGAPLTAGRRAGPPQARPDPHGGSIAVLGERGAPLTEWWTYRLGSFLMFSVRTYDRLVESYNADLWPLQLPALGLGLVALVLAWRARSALHGRVVAAVLCGAWWWVAWAFHYRRFTAINWAAEYVAWVFAAQGLALFWFGVVRARLASRQAASPVRTLALVMVVFALLGYPLISVLQGRPWAQAEVFGVMPDPTAIATIGFVLLAQAAPRWLLVVPVAACALSGAMLWTLHVT